MYSKLCLYSEITVTVAGSVYCDHPSIHVSYGQVKNGKVKECWAVTEKMVIKGKYYEGINYWRIHYFVCKSFITKLQCNDHKMLYKVRLLASSTRS